MINKIKSLRRSVKESGVQNILLIFLFITILIVSATGFWNVLSAAIFPNTTIGLYKRDFWPNFLVSAHVLLLDIFFIGVILFYLDKSRERRNAIRGYCDELSDSVSLESDESVIKKVRIIRNLTQLGAKNIKAHRAYLACGRFKELQLKSFDLTGSIFTDSKFTKTEIQNCNIRSSNFSNCQMNGTEFIDCILYRSNFNQASLRGVKFKSTDLKNTDFSNCDLQSSCFENSDLSLVDFKGANLRNCSFKNCKGVDAISLSKAEKVDYLVAPKEILEELRNLRADMKWNKHRKLRPRGIEPPDL